MSKSTQYLIDHVNSRDADKPEFVQAAIEIINSLEGLFEEHPEYVDTFARLLEPERLIQFRVPWVDDKGTTQVNRAWRIVFNTAIGPGKGGLRFHPTVTASVLSFLALEQTFKNSLTGLPMGGAKGGSDFNPKGKSDREVMAFCQSFMTELYRHIGVNTDVPAGDIGVGAREIGYLFGQYKRLTHAWEPVLTGKGQSYGGSLIRPEATGYGVVFYLNAMLKHNHKSIVGARCLVSGSGNVATFAAQKLIDLGAKVLTLSDSNGTIYFKAGMTKDDLSAIMHLKNVQRGRLSELSLEGASYHKDLSPWNFDADIAIPCATQNEVDEADAERLIGHGIWALVEGANMPLTNEAAEVLHKHNILYGVAKAANCGGVMVSGFEISQNQMRLSWSATEVENKLQVKMEEIFLSCAEAGAKYGRSSIDYQTGANVVGAIRVLEAMNAQGCV